MQAMLNFSKKEIEKVEKVLSEFEMLGTKSEYEILRCKKGVDTITLYSSGKLLIQGPRAEQSKEEILGRLGFEKEMVLGIDETGRGEDFGPMVVAGVLGDKNQLRELRDSKKIRDLNKRFEIISKNSLMQAGISFNAELIDSLREKGFNLNKIEGITMNKLIELIEELGLAEGTGIRIDGKPLKEVKNRKAEFIVRGDDLDPVIGAASVVAKKTRNESKDSKKRMTWKTESG